MPNDLNRNGTHWTDEPCGLTRGRLGRAHARPLQLRNGTGVPRQQDRHMERLAMSSTMRGADIVARSLERLGCRRIFTLSGNHIMSLFDTGPLLPN
jgi:hypothetical protein